MGCDIHIYVEVKYKNKSDWEVFKEDYFELTDFGKSYYKKEKSNILFDNRDYTMFGFLAGVRDSEIIPAPYSKGLPDSVAQEVSDDYTLWDLDAHSVAHLYVSQLLEFDYSKNAYESEPLKNYYTVLGGLFFKNLKELNLLLGRDNIENVRLVYWFDN